MPLSCLRIVAAMVTGAACAIVAIRAEAGEPSSEETQKRIEELVQQLGNDSFQARGRAAEELVKCGMQTKAALFEGMQSKDLEIASRCRRLWFEVRIDAGWQHVREMIGDSPRSRELFDQMFLAAPEFWYELADAPRGADVLFE